MELIKSDATKIISIGIVNAAAKNTIKKRKRHAEKFINETKAALLNN